MQMQMQMQGAAVLMVQCWIPPSQLCLNTSMLGVLMIVLMSGPEQCTESQEAVLDRHRGA